MDYNIPKKYVTATVKRLEKFEQNARSTDVVSGPIPRHELLQNFVEDCLAKFGLKLDEDVTLDIVSGYIRRACELHVHKLRRVSEQEKPGTLSAKVLAWAFRERFPMESVHARFNPERTRQKRGRSPSPPPAEEGEEQPPQKKKNTARTTPATPTTRPGPSRKKPTKRRAPSPGEQPATTSPPTRQAPTPAEKRPKRGRAVRDAPTPPPPLSPPPSTPAAPPAKGPVLRPREHRPCPLANQKWLPEDEEGKRRFLLCNPRYTYSRQPAKPVYEYAAVFDSREVDPRPKFLPPLPAPQGMPNRQPYPWALSGPPWQYYENWRNQQVVLN